MSTASSSNTKKDKRITAEQTIILIRLIKKYKSLWDSNSNDFRNRTVNNNLYTKIGSYFHLTGDDVKRKFRRLRTCYMQELKLIQDEQKEYPSLFYFDEMEFLKEQIEKHLTKSTPSVGSPISSAKDETEDGATVGSFEEYYIESPSDFSPKNNEAETNSITLEEVDTEDIVIGEESIREPITTPEDTTDEFDAFAGYLASQLREMDKLSALETMEDLQRLISQRRIGIIKNAVKRKAQPEVQYRYSLKRFKTENSGRNVE